MRLGRIQNNYTAEGFALVKNQGLDFIEICCNSQADAEKLIAAKDSVSELIRTTGIDVSCVGRWNHDIQANGSIDTKKKESYLALMDTAIDLGAKTFVCGCNYDGSISLWKNYSNAIEFLRELIIHADGRIKVAVQNCDWNNFIVSPKHWEVVLGELPELMIKFDASHAYNRGESYTVQLSDWCERVAHIHVKGTVHAGPRKVDDPPAGMDDLNWNAIFAILYSRKYNGDLSIEPHSATWSGELGQAGVEFTARFISKYLLP
ncbi:MAG: sugar phosphate isomerase/epimerase [Clostridia bacterium]|nr:sugar phosphate isomerase/epimerase [Clostridia bacterium]